MDPISIATSVVGATVACLKITKVLNSLRPKYLDASTTIAALCSESTLVSASLSQIQTLLLQNSETMAERLQTRPELAATLDTTLTSCTVIFACLEEEVNQLKNETGSEDDPESWKQRTKTVWKANTMRELLKSIRGQQSAVTLLIQMLQMESLSDIQRVMNENTALLHGVVQCTRSLRSLNPRVSASIPESLIGYKDAESVLRVDGASTIYSTEFEFDDQLVNSKAYRRAFASVRRKVPPGVVHKDVDGGDLIDLSNQNSSEAGAGLFSKAPQDLKGLRFSPDISDNQNRTLPCSPTQSLRSKPHAHRESSTSSQSSSVRSLQTPSAPRLDFWSSIPDLTLDDKSVPIVVSPYSDDSSSIYSRSTTSYETSQTQPSTYSSVDSNYRPSTAQTITGYSTWEQPLQNSQREGEDSVPISDCPYADFCPIKLRPDEFDRHFQHHITLERQREHQIRMGDTYNTSPPVYNDTKRRVRVVQDPKTQPLIYLAGQRCDEPASRVMRQSVSQPQTMSFQEPVRKKKTVTFQLPESPQSKKEFDHIASGRAAIEERLRKEREQFEARKTEWDQRRRVQPSISPPSPSSGNAGHLGIGYDNRSTSDELTYNFPSHLPATIETDGSNGLSSYSHRVPTFRGADLQAAQPAPAAVMRAAQSVYTLNTKRPALPPHNSYQLPWRPASQSERYG
ncbi:hypothetical protein CC78DRAFT_621640 [Lojkania enalia]|uniref:Fungal N-terminal domain-containing protein n=1 Tax=Lojkania enalia TaxID=147567 RepID=A0A9P4MV73_9PLEO|nr:hypothetical protein CC78DRAFT_621640 [Didymosphaeria enalia]